MFSQLQREFSRGYRISISAGINTSLDRRVNPIARSLGVCLASRLGISVHIYLNGRVNNDAKVYTVF